MNDKEIIEAIQRLWIETFSSSDVAMPQVRELPQAGSDRRYFRITHEGHRCIATFVPSPKEGRCFVEITKVFNNAGGSVPEIYACSDDGRIYLQEDLGDTSLFLLIHSDDCKNLVEETLRRLVTLQKVPLTAWKDKVMHEAFSQRQALWDLNYFKYDFLKPYGVDYDENLLEDDFIRLSKALTEVSSGLSGFMMRDCQSRNVMITDAGPIFIDYQGGRLGPVLYDAVSFLWQARADFSDDFRHEMLDVYIREFCGDDSEMMRQMMDALPEVALFRTLQVLGAYGFRGLIQGRPHFLLSIPNAISNLKGLSTSGWLDRYPELKKIALNLNCDALTSASLMESSLTVEIVSFSYKRGYPVDLSGNGGGFAFDCRAMHNPGRYAQYKHLTGRDKEVIDFLEERGEVRSFLNNVWGLTDPAVERYLSRGFTHLQISFGCTGGQHRSVYCAEATYRHIREIFPEARVIVTHREHP